MQLHEIQPVHRLKKKKRLGRGGKKGDYCGKGMKGQKSRAGRKFQPFIREWIKKYPKLRGYKNKPKVKGRGLKVIILNLEILEKQFNSGEKISPNVLLEKGVVCKMKGRIPQVKILANGKLTKKLIIEGCLFSKQAEEKIKKAGGKIKF